MATDNAESREPQADEPRHPMAGGLEAWSLIDALKLAERILPGVGMAGKAQWPDLPETVDFRTESQAFELRLRFDTKARVCAIYTAPAPPAREGEEKHRATEGTEKTKTGETGNGN